MKEVFEKIINYIHSEISRTTSFAEHETLINVKFFVHELEEEHNSGWISVEDALPEEKGTYLVTVKHFGVTFARFTGQKDNLHFDANVIAWMDIPAPYKKGE